MRFRRTRTRAPRPVCPGAGIEPPAHKGRGTARAPGRTPRHGRPERRALGAVREILRACQGACSDTAAIMRAQLRPGRQDGVRTFEKPARVSFFAQALVRSFT